MSATDTIAAIATPPGAGGIAIVRISGPAARRVAEVVFRRRGGGGFRAVARVYVGRVVEIDGSVVDEALAFYMAAPRSYTGEDVIEIQCHGGSLVSRRVLELVLAAGARAAEPGEFTRRGFEHGRLDLAQAEAVTALIEARSETARRLATSQLEGVLSTRVNALREVLLSVLALCEAAIDFPDEDLPELAPDALSRELGRLRGEVESLLAASERARVRYEGARVVLVGKPNVGKSSLLNALAGRERSIVTPVAGTTRDVVEVTLDLGGAAVTLADTAGVREPEDALERLGVERTRGAIADAACALVVVDGSRPFDEEDARVADAVRNLPSAVVLNKSDLPPVVSSREVEACFGGSAILSVSAVTGTGVDQIGGVLASMLQTSDDGETLMFRVRHREAALRAVEDVGRAEAAAIRGAPLELVASDLRCAADALGTITGAVTSEDVLDLVFAEFCVGK